MARKITTRKTSEQRREEANALQASIADQVANLPAQWLAYLGAVQRFGTYSLNNILLILSQRPDATQVAGFRQWQKAGRQVNRGAKSIKIFGFATKKYEDDDGEEATRTYYPVLSVFDIADTSPIESAEQGSGAVNANPTQRFSGEDPDGIYAAVEEYLSSEGWNVSRETLAGRLDGYTRYDTREVKVEASHNPALAADTILHEAAHALMHAHDAPGEYVAHRGLKECEAESVAYVVAGVLGLDTAQESIGYIAGWTKQDADLIRTTAERVLATSQRLLDALTAAEEATG